MLTDCFQVATLLPVMATLTLNAFLPVFPPQPIIRQAACVGLGKAYNKHVSSKWVPSQDDTQHDLGGKPSRSKGKGKEKVVREG